MKALSPQRTDHPESVDSAGSGIAAAMLAAAGQQGDAGRSLFPEPPAFRGASTEETEATEPAAILRGQPSVEEVTPRPPATSAGEEETSAPSEPEVQSPAVLPAGEAAPAHAERAEPSSATDAIAAALTSSSPTALSEALTEQMESVHRKFVAHLNAKHKDLLIKVRTEMGAHMVASQQATSRLLSEVLAAQATEVRRERTTVLQQERSNMERLLAAISETLNEKLPQRMAEVVRAELAAGVQQGGAAAAAAAAAVGPAVQQALQGALPKVGRRAVAGQGAYCIMLHRVGSNLCMDNTSHRFTPPPTPHTPPHTGAVLCC
jgi:hypothetical protein